MGAHNAKRSMANTSGATSTSGVHNFGTGDSRGRPWEDAASAKELTGGASDEKEATETGCRWLAARRCQLELADGVRQPSDD
jgi:hypothetical protein